MLFRIRIEAETAISGKGGGRKNSTANRPLVVHLQVTGGALEENQWVTEEHRHDDDWDCLWRHRGVRHRPRKNEPPFQYLTLISRVRPPRLQKSRLKAFRRRQTRGCTVRRGSSKISLRISRRNTTTTGPIAHKPHR